MPLADYFDLRDAEDSLGQANTDRNAAIDDLLEPIVDHTPLGQLVGTANEEQPPFTDDPDHVGVFDPSGFVFDLLG